MKKTLHLILLMMLTASLSPLKAQELTEEPSEDIFDKIASFYQSGLDEKLYLQLDKPYYSSGDKIWFKGYLRNAITHTPLLNSNYIYVELVEKGDKLVSRVKVKRDDTGFNGYMILDPEMEAGDYTLRGYSRWMLNQDEAYIFNRSIKIVSPIPETAMSNDVDSTRRQKRRAEKRAVEPKDPTLDYSVQFFPEGGALLANNLQIVAFKAIGSDGLAVDITGTIYGSDGKAISDFESIHQGMGSVAIFASAAQQYFAITKNSDGVEQRFELPAVEERGVVVNARQSGGRVVYQLKTADTTLIEGAQFIIHSHGRLISVNDVGSSSIKAISIDKLFEGVNVISLVSADGTILSERLIFKRPEVSPLIEISTSRKNYGRREKAKIKLNVADSFGMPTTGEFGISVTDDSAIKFNEGDENILSYLLLTSDLHGYIESPGQYFTGDLTAADRNLDLLMMTQGWRRFDLEKILAGELPANEIRAEEQTSISGHIKGFFGNEARKPEIIVICPMINYLDTFTLESSNEFKLVGLDMPDSATYVIQSRTRTGGNTLTLNIDPEIFAPTRSTVAPRPEQAYVPMAFVNQSQEQFFYDGGMALISMDEVVVTTSTVERDGVDRSTHSSSRDELDQYAALPLSMLIKRFPSMTVMEAGVYYRNSETAARFIVDGMDMEYEDISYLTAMDFEKIEFFSDIAAAMYSDAAGGVFVLELRQGSSVSGERTTSPGIAFITALGYQKPTEFYQPAYEVAENKRNLPPDFRTTIFWDGSLTPDNKGNIEFEFYTADKPTTYTITVEGVTNDGEICRASSQINRTADR